MRRNKDGRPKPTSSGGSGWSELDLAALEGDAFLLGHWKNYQELEESLSMPELIQTLKSMQERDMSQRKFTASLKGINLDEAIQDSSSTFDEIERRALGIETSSDDVVSLQGKFASQEGFGIGAGLGYVKE